MRGTILTYVLYLALLVHVGLLAVVLWRVWRGENVIDRLVVLFPEQATHLSVLRGELAWQAVIGPVGGAR